jgi:thiamine-phosphate pyrophosphorylase
MSRPIGRLHVLTDRLDIATAALAAGAPTVQVRCKRRTDAELYELVGRVVEAARPFGATVLVNDRVDVALATGADGVHLGEHDLPLPVARRLLGPDLLLGGTARDPETAQVHQRAGADYLGVGPTFATASKDGLPAPLGVPRVGEVAAAVDIPVIAIAGIDEARVPTLLDAGVHGVAVIGAIASAPDPFEATERLLRALDRTPMDEVAR